MKQVKTPKNLSQYSKIFSSIVEFDANLKNRHSQIMEKDQQMPFQPEVVNDTFSLIQKAYWKLYLQIYGSQLTQFDRKQIVFYLTAKNGKSLNGEASQNTSGGNKLPKWFMYKAHTKRQYNQETYQQDNFLNFNEFPETRSKKMKLQNSSSSLVNANHVKHQHSMYNESVDPYHSNIKLQAQNGLPQVEIIHRFFSLKRLLENSKDLVDIEKITTLYKNGNSFDRQDPQQVQEQKQKYREKFRLYTQLIDCYQKYGYGSRRAKKHVKQKVTGVIYQYAVIHMAKIMFKLLEKYVMFFINKKAKFLHRSRLQKISYNIFNLPHFFTEQLKLVFVNLLIIIYQVRKPLPELNNTQIKELYEHIMKRIQEKQKNPQGFKNQYMMKLQNPTFYNVKKQLREHVKVQSDLKKKLGIKAIGRHSHLAKQYFNLRKSMVAIDKTQTNPQQKIKQQQALDYLQARRQRKRQNKFNIKKDKNSVKKQTKKQNQSKKSKLKYQPQNQQDYNSYYQDQDQDQDQQNEFIKQQNNISYFYSDSQSQDIRNYFKSQKKHKSQKSQRPQKSKHKKQKKDKSKGKDKKDKKNKKKDKYN